MSLSATTLWLAGHRRDREVALAREAEARASLARQAEVFADERRFASVSDTRADGPNVVLGTSESGVPYRFGLGDFDGTFGWLTAGTGLGKSRLLGAICQQVFEHMYANESATVPVSLVLCDVKGEIHDLAARSLAGVISRLPAERRAAALSRVTNVSFFEGAFLPEWQILKREPGVSPTAQAYAVAEIIEATVGASLGSRQVTAFGALLSLGIEAGLSLLDVRYLLYDQAKLLSLARASKIPDARLFVEMRLSRERPATIDGIASRLDALLRVESIKAALAGPGMLDLKRAFEPGSATLISFGGSPLGSDDTRRALAALAVSRLTAAVFDPSRKRRGFTVIIADELQDAITPATLHCITRLLSTARSFGVSMISAHQSAEQLPKEIQTIMNTNCRVRILGRSSEADARLAAEWLPRTGRVPKPHVAGDRSGSDFLTDAEELRFRVVELGRLERQHFLVADRAATFQARVVRAPHFDPPSWSTIDRSVSAAVRRGSAGRPRTELLARAEEIERRAAASLSDGAADTPAPRRRAIARQPDAVTSAGSGAFRLGDVP